MGTGRDKVYSIDLTGHLASILNLARKTAPETGRRII
jgi:hypothetical protein